MFHALASAEIVSRDGRSHHRRPRELSSRRQAQRPSRDLDAGRRIAELLWRNRPIAILCGLTRKSFQWIARRIAELQRFRGGGGQSAPAKASAGPLARRDRRGVRSSHHIEAAIGTRTLA